MSEPQSTKDLAARLIAHAWETDPAGPVEAAALAIHRMSAELSRLLGVDGCLALLKRVLGRARQTHDALVDVRVVLGSDPHLEVPEVVEGAAAEELAAGLETTLVALFDLLGRLVGEDLSFQFAEMSIANAASDSVDTDEKRDRGH